MHILHGANPFATYPRIIGHEFAGHVAASGAESGFAVGDRVVIDPVISCGRCHPCRTGRHNVCARLQVFGVHRDGGFRSRVVVPAANAVRIPAGMSADIAALAEPFSIAANVLLRTGCNADDVVLIYGAGTVGITVLQVAKLHGARCIIADLDDARLERAAGFGADLTLNPRRVSVPDSVAGELDGLGPSIVIDGAGVPALFAEMCRLAAPAGRIGLLGFSEEPTPMVQKDIVGKELSIVGSRLNRGLLPQVVAWLASGRLNGAAMITQTFAAKDARAAFDLIEQHPDRTIKVQLAFD
jgi:L-gulonate 5-dehydrogenase